MLLRELLLFFSSPSLDLFVLKHKTDSIPLYSPFSMKLSLSSSYNALIEMGQVPVALTTKAKRTHKLPEHLFLSFVKTRWLKDKFPTPVQDVMRSNLGSRGDIVLYI